MERGERAMTSGWEKLYTDDMKAWVHEQLREGYALIDRLAELGHSEGGEYKARCDYWAKKTGYIRA